MARSRTRSRPHGLSVVRPRVPSGSGARSASSRASRVDRRRDARAVVERRASPRPRTCGSRPTRRGRSSSRTACRSSTNAWPRRPRRRGRRPPSLAFPSSSRRRLAGAHKTETGGVVLDLADRAGRPRRRRPNRRRRGGPADAERERGASRRARPGPALRPARRPRPRRRVGGADRRRGHPHRAAHGRRRARARHSKGRRAPSCAATAASRPQTPTLSSTSSTGSPSLGEDLPEVVELDLNPVFAGPDGCVAVDARVRVSAVEPSHRAKTW